MAAVLNKMYLSVLLIAAVSCNKDEQKVFSDFKRCLDEECSMLMCRGKAVRDFAGPDCRFLKFKKGETIYVYYKLAGKRNDLWAGSVGSQFGYFPKDLIEINLIYSTTEVELPAEDTDFVCFDGGPEEFDYIDFDRLVRADGEGGDHEGKTKSQNNNNVAKTEESAREKRDEDTGQKVPVSDFEKTPEVPENKPGDDQTRDNKEAIQFVDRNVSDSPLQIEEKDEETVDSILNGEKLLHVEDGESVEKPADVGENFTSLEEHSTDEDGSSHVKVSALLEPNSQGLRTSPPTHIESEELSEDAKDTRVSQGEGELSDTVEHGSREDKREAVFELDASSELETTFRSTIDAIVVDDELTSKVTTLDEEPVFDFELQKDELAESPEKVPLLMYSDNKSQQHPELPEEDNVQNEDIGEDHVAKPKENDTKTTTQTADLPVASVDPEKGQSKQALDGVTEEPADVADGDAGTSEGENSQSKGLWTTLGDTFYAVVSGGETTSKVTYPHSTDSEDIQEDVRERSIEDLEEKDRIYLLSMSEEEVEDELVNRADDAIKERSSIVIEDYEDEDTIHAFVRTSESDTNFETSNEETEQGQRVGSKAESQGSGLQKESESKKKGLTFNEEVGNDEFLKVPEKDTRSRKIELQTLKHPDAEGKSETGTNRSSQKLDQLEPEIETDKLSDSESRWSKTVPAEVLDAENGGLGSQNKTEALTRERFSAEDLHAKRSQGGDEAKEHQTSFSANGENLQDRKTVKKDHEGLKEYDLVKNDWRDIDASLDSNSKLFGDNFSEKFQEAMDDKDFDVPEEPYDADRPEELLEDENAAEARMARISDSNVTDDEEGSYDDQELDVESVNLEERNTVGLEDQEDRGESTTNGFKETVVEQDHEVEEHGELAQNIQGQLNKTESPKKSEQPYPGPVDENGLDTESEGQSQRLKHLSEVLQKEAGKFDEGKGHKTEERAVDEGRWSETYSNSENTSNPSEVEENKEAEEPVDQKKDIRSEDGRKMTVGPKYSEAVEQLTILKGYFDEENIERLHRYLGPRQVLELEAVLHDFEEELRLAKLSRANQEDVENVLDYILEKSEMTILDMVESMLDERAEENHWKIEENSQTYDEETVLLSDLQELVFQIRVKYSASRDAAALAIGVKLPQESKHLPHASLDHSKQKEQERDTTEAQEEEEKEVRGEEEEKNEQPTRGLPFENFTEDAARSERDQEQDGGEEPHGRMQSGNLTEKAAYQERKEGEETARGLASAESAKETPKERPSVNISESAAPQEREEEAARKPSSLNFTEIAGHPKRKWEEMEGGEEAAETPPPPNVTGSTEEAQKGPLALNFTENAAPQETGQRNGKERKREAPSPNVGERAEEEVGRKPPLLNTRESREEPQKEAPVVSFAESVAHSDGTDTVEEGSLKEQQQEEEVTAQATAEEGAELGHLEVEIRTPSAPGNSVTMDRSRLQEGLWLPWIITVLDGVVLQIKDNVWPVVKLLLESLVSSLPEEMRPGPDFHGVPWEPILITAVLGMVTFVVFFWRTCLSVKSRRYQMTEKQLSEKIKQLIQEKTEVLEKVSAYEKKLEEAKTVMEKAQKVKSTVSDETKELKEACRELEQVNLHLETRVKTLQASLEKEKKETAKQQILIADTQKSVKKLQKVISAHSAELTQVQKALCGAKANEEKLQADVRSVLEENARLKQSKSQLLKEAEGWNERHSELNEQIKLCQKAQKDLEETLAYKDNEIEVLTDCVMQLRQLDIESDNEDNGWDKEVDGEVANGELPDKTKRTKMKIQQMMDVSRVKTTLKIIEEEKDHFQAKLTDEIKARHELEEQIKQLEHNFVATETEKSRLENEFKTMQQKLEILTELYHQKEMALQKKLSQEECQRQEKELKLSAADEKALQAVEEVKMYKQRIQEMEEELQKTERSFKNQIATHEKKAHENWLSARSAERTLTEEKRETANLRQKMIELNQKLSQVQRPSIIKPTPGRPDRQGPPGAPPSLGPARRGPLSRDDSYGPSPVSGGAPSPPLMMELPVRPPSVNAGRGFPRDRGDGALRVPPGALPPREWIGPGPDRLGPSSDHGSPPPQWDRRPGPMDGYPGPRRPPSESGVMSGRISGPGEIRGLPPLNRAEMGPGGPVQLPSGPRTSSPNLTESAMQNTVDQPEEPVSFCNPPSSEQSKAVNANTLQPTPSFPGTPIMNSPMGGIPPPGPRHGPPPPTRGTYGPVPLPLPLPHPQNHLVRVPALRDYPPAPFPPPGHRPFLPGPLPPPHVLRDFPPGAREYPHGPRSLPPGPTPPPGSRDYPPGPDNRR
ncbi:transport and Golgi organization protein 1 homolog isoform X2 [Heptranchias perlo]|uniref:transport and Golgi organization protein 1 homolog isoform X2 n=1 Tax=Heptranchias perlo TaxID=212740 RepID=UPI003559E17A